MKKQKQPKYTIKDLRKEFPDDDACLEYIFSVRFPNPVCNECKAKNSFYRVSTRKCYSCSHCGNQIHPLAGTIFHKSSTKLTDWFHALFLFSSSKKGVSGKDLERQLGVTYKTAWRIAKQIRSLMTQGKNPLDGTVEMDETYVGGKRRGGKRGRGTDKEAVVGIAQRGGSVRVKHVDNVKSVTLMPMLRENVKLGSAVMTDEFPVYNRVGRDGYLHEVVQHGIKEYVRGNAHTNTIEGFWSQVKRSISGTHHAVSPKYLQFYLNEFVWKYNHRDSVIPMFHLLLARA
ncbi:MAG: IS1595 family transposase [Patescibacteria group bacterium]